MEHEVLQLLAFSELKSDHLRLRNGRKTEIGPKTAQISRFTF
jgi:hypothetical protein